MNVRRERTERLVLVAADGATTELAAAERVAGSVDSQDELAVSPDGAYLAWSTPEDDRLHLRDAAGHEQILPGYGRRMRFSPDGKWLAAITEVGRGDWHKLIVWELATGQIVALLVADELGRFEWARGGVVIAKRDELVYVSLAGARRSLFAATGGERLERFTAAPAGNRIALFVQTARGLKLRSLDLEQPERIRELGTVRGDRIENAEPSPDGTRVVFATPAGLYAVDGNGAPSELSSRSDVHSLWFGPDGRLAYASITGTTVLDGKRARRNEPQDATRMMRFEKGSSRVLLAVGSELRAWDPATDQQTVLASAQPGDDLLGGERYRGGVVLWVGRDGSLGPNRVARVLRVDTDGNSREIEKVPATIGAASDMARNFVPRNKSPEVTAKLQAILNDPLEPGLTTIGTNPAATRALVCFRGFADGKPHHDLVWVDLVASRAVDLAVSGCWVRQLWLSPDGEQVVFSDYGAFAPATKELELLDMRGAAPPRSLGEGYNEVVFDGHGRLAFASHRGVRVVDTRHDELFETDRPVESPQFAKGSLMFAIGREIIAWDVDHGTRTVLARVPEGQRILGFKVEASGFVVTTLE